MNRKQKTIKVKKERIEYWIEKGTIGCPVKPAGDVKCCITKKMFLNYLKNACVPTTMCEIAMYDNFEDLQKIFIDQTFGHYTYRE